MSEYIRLEDCPGGLFVFENVTYLRTVMAEAYDCRDGSAFWIHPDIFIGSSKADDDLMKSRCNLMVRPIKE